jgi:hypothetical protein
MLRNLFATTAVSLLLVGGTAYAQDATTEAEENLQNAEDTLDEAQQDVEAAQDEMADPAATEPVTAEEATDPAATDAPMTAQDEMAEPMDGDPALTAQEGAVDPAAEMEMSPIDISQITAEQLIGAQVRNRGDEQLGTVDDAVLSDAGEITGLNVSFGGFLGFGENTVELALDEVEFMSDGADNVYVVTDLMPEDLEGRPEVETE